MTAKGEDLEGRYSQASNVIDYITKPFSPGGHPGGGDPRHRKDRHRYQGRGAAGEKPRRPS